MITGNFKTLAEIDKAYRDHIDSLKSWGGPADIEGVEHAWGRARIDWCADHPEDSPF